MKRLIFLMIVVFVATCAFAGDFALGTGYNLGHNLENSSDDGGFFVEGEMGMFRLGAYINGTWIGLSEPTGNVYFGTGVDEAPAIEEQEIDLGQFDGNLSASSMGLVLSADLYETQRTSFFAGLGVNFLAVRAGFKTVQQNTHEVWDGSEFVEYTDILTLSGSASGTGFSLFPHVGAEVRFLDILFVRGKTGLDYTRLGTLKGDFDLSYYDEYDDETSNAVGGAIIKVPAGISTFVWELEVGARIPLGGE